MANNPYVNKVVLGNQVVLDLTQDTAVASDVAQGKTFHDATGALVTGTAQGGGSEERQTDFYPFVTYAKTGNYGGIVLEKFRLGEKDIKEIDKINVQGCAWNSGGSSQQKYRVVGYIFVGEKNGKWCYFNGTSWVELSTVITSSINITPVELGRVNSAGSSAFSFNVDASIPIKDIVELAENNEINLSFPGSTASVSTNGISNTINQDIMGSDCCFMLFSYTYRNPSTTSAQLIYGYSVQKNRYSSADTPQIISANPPQVKIRWKKTYPTPPTVGMVYKDGIFYCPMTDGVNINNMILNSDNIEFGTTDATVFTVPVTENKYDKTQFTDIEIDYYTSEDATVQTLTIPLSSYGSLPSEFSFGVYRDRNNTLTAWYALANGNTLSFYNHLVRLNNSITVYVTRVEVV